MMRSQECEVTDLFWGGFQSFLTSRLNRKPTLWVLFCWMILKTFIFSLAPWLDFEAVFVRIENHIAWALNVCIEAAKVVWQWLILSQTTPCLHPLKYDQQMFREHCRDRFCQKKQVLFSLHLFGLLQISPSWQDFKVRNQHRNKSGSRCEPLTEKD